MVQHCIVTWTSTGIQCVPQSINLWTDDQEISFILGPNTVWGENPVVFYKHNIEGLSIQPWSGSEPVLQPNGTIVAKGPGPADELTTYACTVSVGPADPMGGKAFRHDPEIYNQPQP